MRSQSDGFRPIRQVGWATSVGFPLMIVGTFMIAIAYSVGSTLLWVVAVAMLGGGLLIAGSGRIG